MAAAHNPQPTAGAHAVGAYARISDDRAGQRLGVKRQLKDCLDRAAADGFPRDQVATYVDNDLSATADSPRPEYNRICADIQSGLLRRLYVLDLDRLTRKPIELEALINLVEEHGVQLINLTGEIDLSTASGRAMARMKGVWARMEVERMGERIRRKMLELTEHGQPVGGKRVYGYRWVPGQGRVVEPAEAAIVTEVVKRVLAKESLQSIAWDLTRRGVPTARGDRWAIPLLQKILGNPRPEEADLVTLVKEQLAAGRTMSEITRDLNQQAVPLTRSREWATNTLRQLLTRPALVADLIHQGELIGQGVWEPIVSRQDWEAVQRELSAPERMENARGGVVRHLLSGLIRCGACGESMIVKLGPKGVPRYACNKRGCLRVTINQAKLDGYVIGLVLGWLANPQVRAALEYGPGDQAGRLRGLHQEISRLEAAREDQQAEYADRVAAGETVEKGLAAAAIRKIDERLEAARTELSTITRRTSLLEDVPAVPDPRWWVDLVLGRRRALVELVCGPMTVVPATKRGRVFDATRLEFRGPGHGGDRGPESPPCPT